jgi:hypothetical protein
MQTEKSCLLLWYLLQNLYELAVYCAPRDLDKPIKLKHLKAVKDTKAWYDLCTDLYTFRNLVVHNPSLCHKSKIIDSIITNPELGWLVGYCCPEYCNIICNTLLNYKDYLNLKGN